MVSRSHSASGYTVTQPAAPSILVSVASSGAPPVPPAMWWAPMKSPNDSHPLSGSPWADHDDERPRQRRVRGLRDRLGLRPQADVVFLRRHLTY